MNKKLLALFDASAAAAAEFITAEVIGVSRWTNNLQAHTHTFFPILQTHEGSHREIYQEFQPSYDIFRRSGAKGCSNHRFLACTPSLHCPTSI